MTPPDAHLDRGRFAQNAPTIGVLPEGANRRIWLAGYLCARDAAEDLRLMTGDGIPLATLLQHHPNASHCDREVSAWPCPTVAELIEGILGRAVRVWIDGVDVKPHLDHFTYRPGGDA